MPRPKKAAVALPKKVDEALNEVERCFIENNNIPTEELAKKLGKPESVIKAYCVWYEKMHPPKKPVPKALSMLDRPAKDGGVVCMTQEASMEGNQENRRSVTLESINRAMNEGRLQDAQNLKVMFDEQQKAQKKHIRDVHSPHLHYINGPDDDPTRGAY